MFFSSMLDNVLVLGTGYTCDQVHLSDRIDCEELQAALLRLANRTLCIWSLHEFTNLVFQPFEHLLTLNNIADILQLLTGQLLQIMISVIEGPLTIDYASLTLAPPHLQFRHTLRPNG